MKRIVIVGLSGAGKSVFAKKLSTKFDVPVYHLDQYYWKPGWIECQAEEFKAIHQKLIAQPQWILDGNCMITIQERIQAADTIFYFDFPRLLCLWRIVKRRFFYSNKRRTDRPRGCEERITWPLVRYVLWRFKSHYHPRIVSLLSNAQRDGKKVYIIYTSKDSEKFLRAYI